jgi:hypothetical protein
MTFRGSELPSISGTLKMEASGSPEPGGIIQEKRDFNSCAVFEVLMRVTAKFTVFWALVKIQDFL